MNWWNELTGLQQFFASIAMPATLVMIIQFILFMLGFSHGDGGDGADGIDGTDFSDGHAEVDFHEDVSHDVFEAHSSEASNHHPDMGHDNVDALRLFTLRSIIAFMAVGGWMGVAAIGWKVPTPAVFILAFLSGWLALYFVAWSIRAALRLQQSGNIIIDNAIGKQCEVYLPIPKSKGGFGKVNVIVQDRLCEFDAVTVAYRQLKTGEKVTVTGVESEGVLLVMPQDNPPEGVIIEKF